MEIYRLILKTPRPGMNYPEGVSYDTGATYAGCAQNNTRPCDPQQFNHLKDAVDYAAKRGEVPVTVQSAEQTWAILEGRQPITDDMVIQESGGLSDIVQNPLTMGALILGGLFLYNSRRGKKSDAWS